jgi:N-acetylneuraminate synthase/N,N'-diacetyllegionaminate synthase
MKIGGIDLDRQVMIVAEVGNNHEGSFALAEEMIGRAAETGVNAVKFQTIVPEELISATQTERIKQLGKFRLSYKDFEKLARIANQEKVLFLSTPFDIESARFLDSLVSAHKIASGDNIFFPLLDVIARTGKPILLSTGLTDLDEIVHTKNFIFDIWNQLGIHQELAVLHCVSCYPTPASEANLLAISTLKELGTTVGYSDHTLGIEAAVLSVALGARIIEKHFTLDKEYSEFRDHRLAADPDELSLLVRWVRKAEQMLGTGEKDLAECEKESKETIRRSIAAKADLAFGTIIKWEHLRWVRPGNGLPPGEEKGLLGRVLKRSVKAGELLFPEDMD